MYHLVPKRGGLVLRFLIKMQARKHSNAARKHTRNLTFTVAQM